MNHVQAMRESVRERSAWASKEGRIVKQFVDDLIRLAKEDYDHQSGPRGVSTNQDDEKDIALREVRENLERTYQHVREDVECGLMDYWFRRTHPRY